MNVLTMQNMPIDSIDEITPEWLTRVLKDGGYLTGGTVSDVENRFQTSNWASNAVLRLSYSADALGEKPTKLFFKLCNPGIGTFGDSEMVYYSIVAAEISDAPFHAVIILPIIKEMGNITYYLKIYLIHMLQTSNQHGNLQPAQCFH